MLRLDIEFQILYQIFKVYYPECSRILGNVEVRRPSA